tara:strand:- start:14 stop:628 length:615 start_codon:yes stop_codon:yes gene_type:complete
MLLLNNLEFKRSNKIIFKDINISASTGKIILINGNNGSGKTSLLKTIVNVLEPTNGEIFWMGKKIKKNIFNFFMNTTFIMDQPTSSKNLTVIENIFFWKNLTMSKISFDEIIKLLEILGLIKYKNTQAGYLSLGEIKKLELSRLIIERKKLWLLDEPYNNLDNNSIDIINQTFIDHSNKEGIVLFSSHFEPSIPNYEIIAMNNL